MKITLVEFDVGTAWSRYQITAAETEVLWISYAPGVWATSFSGDFSLFNSDLIGAEFTWYGAPALPPAGSAAGESAITRVGSVFVDNVRLPNTINLPQLLDLGEAGFYFDDSDEILYVKFPANAPPDIYSVVAGVSTLTSNKEWIDEENNRTYSADLISLPQVTKTIDPLFFGRIQYNDATITLLNQHGEYDLLADFDAYGQEVRILYGDSDRPYSQFRRMWTGYIDDFQISEDELSIRASDSRKLLEKPVPVNFFSATDFSDLNDRDEGRPIPLAYGKVSNVNPMCVNRGIYNRASAQTYTWKLCDTQGYDGIKEITAVRYKGQALTLTAGTPNATQYGNVDLSAGTFTTHKAANDTYDFRDVEVDFVGVERGGVAIEDGLDVIVDLIDTYGGIPFSNVRYNQSQWNAATAPNVGLYIDRDTTIAQQIERIAASLRIQFDVQGDGRFTVREFDPDAEPRTTIREDEILTPINAQYSSDEFASRIYVNYVGGVLRDLSEEASIVDRYKTTRPAEFDTVLTNDTDAQAFADDILSLAKDFPPLISVRFPIPAIDLNIEDNVYAILNRLHKPWFGRVKCRIEGITYDFDSEQIVLDLRGFERVDDEGLIVYSQGFSFGTIGFGGPFSETQYPEI